MRKILRFTPGLTTVIVGANLALDNAAQTPPSLISVVMVLLSALYMTLRAVEDL